MSSSPIPEYIKTYNEPLYGFDASKAAVSYQDSPLNQNSSNAFGNVGAYGGDFSLKYGDYSWFSYSDQLVYFVKNSIQSLYPNFSAPSMRTELAE